MRYVHGPRRALVTGGAGFLGSHLCERLLASDFDVVCVDNLLTGSAVNIAHLLSHSRFQLVECDIEEIGEIPGAIGLVLHFASPASPADYLQFPIETLRAGSSGTLHALEVARAKQARFILASTSEVYGDPLEHPQQESYWGNVNPVGARSAYDEAKRFSEALTTVYRKTLGVNTAIVRIFNTYGPRMRIKDGRAVPTFARQAIRGEPLTVTGDGQQTRSFCYVDDTVDGVLMLAQSGHPGPVNIGSEEELAVSRLAAVIIEIAGSRSTINFVERPADDPRARRPDTALARKVLDWAPKTPLESGLKRSLAWFADQLGAEGNEP